MDNSSSLNVESRSLPRPEIELRKWFKVLRKWGVTDPKKAVRLRGKLCKSESFFCKWANAAGPASNF